jgi:hypothetical protein
MRPFMPGGQTMAEAENREKVMLLTESYRILGEMRLGPDGTILDFKHRPNESFNESFVTVYDAQCFRLTDGKRMYDATTVEVSRQMVVAVFRQQDVAFIRKEPAQ